MYKNYYSLLLIISPFHFLLLVCYSYSDTIVIIQPERSKSDYLETLLKNGINDNSLSLDAHLQLVSFLSKNDINIKEFQRFEPFMKLIYQKSYDTFFDDNLTGFNWFDNTTIRLLRIAQRRIEQEKINNDDLYYDRISVMLDALTCLTSKKDQEIARQMGLSKNIKKILECAGFGFFVQSLTYLPHQPLIPLGILLGLSCYVECKDDIDSIFTHKQSTLEKLISLKLVDYDMLKKHKQIINNRLCLS